MPYDKLVFFHEFGLHAVMPVNRIFLFCCIFYGCITGLINPGLLNFIRVVDFVIVDVLELVRDLGAVLIVQLGVESSCVSCTSLGHRVRLFQ